MAKVIELTHRYSHPWDDGHFGRCIRLVPVLFRLAPLPAWTVESVHRLFWWKLNHLDSSSLSLSDFFSFLLFFLDLDLQVSNYYDMWVNCIHEQLNFSFTCFCFDSASPFSPSSPSRLCLGHDPLGKNAIFHWRKVFVPGLTHDGLPCRVYLGRSSPYDWR